VKDLCPCLPLIQEFPFHLKDAWFLITVDIIKWIFPVLSNIPLTSSILKVKQTGKWRAYDTGWSVGTPSSILASKEQKLCQVVSLPLSLNWWPNQGISVFLVFSQRKQYSWQWDLCWSHPFVIERGRSGCGPSCPVWAPSHPCPSHAVRCMRRKKRQWSRMPKSHQGTERIPQSVT